MEDIMTLVHSETSHAKALLYRDDAAAVPHAYPPYELLPGIVPNDSDDEFMGITVDKYTVASDGVDAVNVTGIPFGAYFSVHGAVQEHAGELMDTAMNLTFDTPGEYKLFLRKEGFIPVYVSILVT